eukprot:488697-Hanusia_phi.AAC.1
MTAQTTRSIKGVVVLICLALLMSILFSSETDSDGSEEVNVLHSWHVSLMELFDQGNANSDRREGGKKELKATRANSNSLRVWLHLELAAS